MYSCVLFDMDGTLVNSYEGIYHAYAWTMEQMGLPFSGRSFVERVIGAPLVYVFQKFCGLGPEDTAQAIELYRDYYAEKGKRQAKAYDGIAHALCVLKRAGCFLGVATLKRETFAKEILDALGLLSYFDVVCGMDAGDQLHKADLIRRCMTAAGAEPADTLLIGDSAFDGQGAGEAGVDFLAVTYGFGFREETPANCGAVMTVDRPAAIPGCVLK